MVERIYWWLSDWWAGKPLGGLRSKDWSKTQKEAVAEHPFCAFHGGKGTILNPLNVHHKKPFHLFPALELDKKNLLVACRFCHLWFCHLGNWKLFNDKVEEMANTMLDKIRSSKLLPNKL